MSEPRPHRPPPRLVLELPLEGRPRVYVDAATEQDERRLVTWLAHAHHTLDNAVQDALHRLDEAA